MPEQENNHVYFGFDNDDLADEFESDEWGYCPQCDNALSFDLDPEFAFCDQCLEWWDKGDL